MHGERGGVVGTLDLETAARDLRADDRNHPRPARKRPGIVKGEMTPAPGALPARLHRRAATPDDADALAELDQHLLIPAAEPFAGGRENDHRDHSPEDP